MVKRVQKKERMIARLRKVLLFLAVFNVLAIPLYAALYADFSYKPLQELDAKMLGITLNALGHGADVSGHEIILTDAGYQKIEISWDSTGWKSMYAVAALIIATPIAGISRKMKFAVIGIATIFALNYLRIATTILISVSFGFNLFDVLHTVLWREGLILGVVGFWFLWLRMEKYNIGKIK